MTTATEVSEGLELQLGWMSLVLPVAIAAIGAIIRAFTAESRILKDCGDDVAHVRDLVLSERVRPTIAAVIVNIQPYVDFTAQSFLPGEPGDPEIETRRVLGANPIFFNSYAALESDYSEIHRAQSVYDRRVEHVKRIGIAASVFLVAWIYAGLWLCMPTVNFPVALSLIVLVVLGTTLGWICAEALGSVRESNYLSSLARKARISGGSTR